MSSGLVPSVGRRTERPYRARGNVLRKALAQEQLLIDPTPESRWADTTNYPYMISCCEYCPLHCYHCYFIGLADDFMEQIHWDRKGMSS